MADPRLYVDDALKPGARLKLDEGQSRKLTATLRLSAGAPVRVFNPRDGEWRAAIEAEAKRGVTLQVLSLLREPKAAPDLDLLFAPLKRDATDLLIEKATELGVRRLKPVITQRTIAETVRVERLGLIARSATEQCERFDAPEVAAAMSLAKALDGWDAARPLIYADEAGDDLNAPWGGDVGRARPIAEALKDVKAEGVSLLIGPEGGFTPEERKLLRGLSYVIPVSLGPRILRAETAAMAALTVIQAVWGDWRGN